MKALDRNVRPSNHGVINVVIYNGVIRAINNGVINGVICAG